MKHLKIFHELQLHCPICNHHATKVDEYERHCKNFHDLDIYNSSKMYTATGFVDLNEDPTEETKYVEKFKIRNATKCLICTKIFYETEEVNRHCTENHVLSNVEYTCLQCFGKFKSKLSWNIHQKKHERSTHLV